MNKLKQRHLLLVDVHPLFRHCFELVLSREEPAFSSVAHAGSLAEVRAHLAFSTPDVALVSLYLPDNEALDSIKELRESGVEVAALTCGADPADRARAMAAGARVVISISEALEELIAAVRGLGGLPLHRARGTSEASSQAPTPLPPLT
jgi:DNA-binding NarL/FixJ family response regulator